MYSAVLLAHSWLRWIALVAAVGTMLAALRIQIPTDRSAADRWSLAAMAALDLQMLLGLLLYFALSPFTAEALKNMSAAMQNSQLRFWAVEHASSMLVAVVLAHLGRSLVRRATTPPDVIRRRLLIFFGLATILMLVGIPWPGFANGRPLFRL
jgi:heme A synthase